MNVDVLGWVPTLASLGCSVTFRKVRLFSGARCSSSSQVSAAQGYVCTTLLKALLLTPNLRPSPQHGNCSWMRPQSHTLAKLVAGSCRALAKLVAAALRPFKVEQEVKEGSVCSVLSSPPQGFRSLLPKTR